MSRGPNPTVIGLFLIVGLLLAVGAAIYFGSVSFGSGNPRFVLFFDESVAGLSEGAKVKLRGVPIGEVTRISLRSPHQDDGDPRIPVFVTIHAEAMRRLSALSRVSDYDVAETMKRAVDRGLRASLQMESLLTGMYYIELDFRDRAAPPVFAQDPDQIECVEIPTIPSQFAAIGRTATEVATQIATIPFAELSGSLLSIAGNLNALLDEVREQAVVGAAEGALDQLREAGRSLDLLAHRLADQVDPVIGDLQATSGDIRQTLQSVREGMDEIRQSSRRIDSLLAPDSPVLFRLEQALASLTEAAESIGRLAEQIDRNPGVLLRGRAPAEPSP